jgi:negative regulator of sigma E activity
MKRLSGAALALAAASFAFAAAHPAADPMDALLLSAMSTSPNVSYTGTVEVVRIGSHAAEATFYRVEHRAPDVTRRFYTAPGALNGDSVLSKGRLVFSIDPKRRRIVEREGDAGSDGAAIGYDYTLLRRNYRAVDTGSETFDGRRVLDVTLINDYSGKRTMAMRIDAVSKIVLDRQLFAADGALVSEVRFEAIRYVAELPPTDFALPTGYQLVHGATFGEPYGAPDRIMRNAGFAARKPRALAEGFAPIDATLVEYHGVRTLHLLYSDGLRTVSLFENAQASTLDAARLQPETLSVNGASALYAEDGPTALLAWSDGALHYTLVGEVGLVDLRHLAQSMEKP